MGRALRPKRVNTRIPAIPESTAIRCKIGLSNTYILRCQSGSPQTCRPKDDGSGQNIPRRSPTTTPYPILISTVPSLHVTPATWEALGCTLRTYLRRQVPRGGGGHRALRHLGPRIQRSGVGVLVMDAGSASTAASLIIGDVTVWVWGWTASHTSRVHSMLPAFYEHHQLWLCGLRHGSPSNPEEGRY